jgi:transcriptional regulator with XRE-family HTH domain
MAVDEMDCITVECRDVMRNVEDQDKAWGRVLLQRRTGAGLRREDIARAAQQVGLRWTATTVAQLESGDRRHWQWLEVELLPVVLFYAGVEDAPRSALLRDVGRITLGSDLSVSSEVLELLGDDATATAINKLETSATRQAQAQMTNASALMKEARAWGLRKPADVIAAERATLNEAEQKAAARLGVRPIDVAFAAQSEWSRSLTDERDAQVAERTKGRQLTASGLRVLRGHVTRDLVAKVEELLEEEEG